jgi:hypothetical protein
MAHLLLLTCYWTQATVDLQRQTEIPHKVFAPHEEKTLARRTTLSSFDSRRNPSRGLPCEELARSVPEARWGAKVKGTEEDEDADRSNDERLG